jgi:hypothetical protein
MKMKRIGNSFWTFLCKVVTGIVEFTRDLRDALTLGDAPRNLGVTHQTVASVASIAAPIVLPPGTAESLGLAAKHVAVAVSSSLAHHGLPALGWMALKLTFVPSVVLGSAIATCGISILILTGFYLLNQADKRFSVVAGVIENFRAVIDSFKSIFDPRTVDWACAA